MKWIHNTAFWVSNIVLHACWSYEPKVHVLMPLQGLVSMKNARVRGGLLCKMEKWKSCGPRAWTTRQSSQEGHQEPPEHWGNKISGSKPSCETQICNPHSHTLGPFPMFPDRYCYPKLTSSSTGVKSEFWLFRSAFNCRILFFVFDFGGMITWMFENLKEAK